MAYILVNSKTVSVMDRENSNGTTASVSKASGKMAKRTGLASGNRQKGIATRENGSKTNRMEKDTLFIRTIRPIVGISDSF